MQGRFSTFGFEDDGGRVAGSGGVAPRTWQWPPADSQQGDESTVLWLQGNKIGQQPGWAWKPVTPPPGERKPWRHLDSGLVRRCTGNPAAVPDFCLQDSELINMSCFKPRSLWQFVMRSRKPVRRGNLAKEHKWVIANHYYLGEKNPKTTHNKLLEGAPSYRF